ncbi:hypothetical protein [Streptomyces sp. NPDC001286]
MTNDQFPAGSGYGTDFQLMADSADKISNEKKAEGPGDRSEPTADDQFPAGSGYGTDFQLMADSADKISNAILEKNEGDSLTVSAELRAAAQTLARAVPKLWGK